MYSKLKCRFVFLCDVDKCAQIVPKGTLYNTNEKGKCLDYIHTSCSREEGLYLAVGSERLIKHQIMSRIHMYVDDITSNIYVHVDK